MTASAGGHDKAVRKLLTDNIDAEPADATAVDRSGLLNTIKANILALADDSLVKPGGGMTKFNMGNDYPAHLLWVAGGFNP